MKKLLLSIITLCMIFSLSSCGGNEDKPRESDLDNWSEKDFEDALNALDSADKSSGTPASAATASPEASYEAKQEIISASWDSGMVQIDDMLVQLPICLNDWVALGLDYELDLGQKSKDYLFTQNESISLNLTYKGTQLGLLIFTKESEAPETVKDMNPLIEKISIRQKPESITMFFPGGLTFGEPYSSIEEKLGKATEIDGNLTYKYGQIGNSQTDLYYGMNVWVNKDTQAVSSFDIGKSIQETDRKNLSTISFENVPNVQLTSDTHNVTLLWMPEYKQIPAMQKAGRRVDGILNDNGKKYYMSLSFSMLAQKYANPYEYISYGDPILDATDEKGINHKVYNAGDVFIIVCTTDVHIFSAMVSLKDLSDASIDALADLQELVVEIANSVQFQ